MFAEFIDKILSIDREVVTAKIDGATYSTRPLHQILPPELHKPETLCLSTLKGIVDFILFNHDKIFDGNIFLHIDGHDSVKILTDIIAGSNNIRFTAAIAKAPIKLFKFCQYYSLEEFVVSIQSQFVETDLTNNIMQYLGNVASNFVKENKDNGFTQTIEISTGLASKTNVIIKNPMILKPYRTFPEVDQPASQFILRLRDGNQSQPITCALFECDNGLWTLEAKKLISEYLASALADRQMQIRIIH
jgi:hypothetical protein